MLNNSLILYNSSACLCDNAEVIVYVHCWGLNLLLLNAIGLYILYINKIFQYHSLRSVIEYSINCVFFIMYDKELISFNHMYMNYNMFVRKFNRIRLVEFCVKKNRDNIKRMLTQDIEYVVNKNLRFPIEIYVNLNNGILSDIYHEMLSILDSNDRSMALNHSEIHDQGINDAKVAWHHVLDNLNNIINSSSNDDILAGIFNRESYESLYGLNWIMLKSSSSANKLASSTAKKPT